MKKIVLITVMLIGVLFAQSFSNQNRESILFSNANMESLKRNFKKSNSLLADILKINPKNKQAISLLIKNYIATRQYTNAQKKLDEYKNALSLLEQTELEITISISTGNFANSQKIANMYLQKQGNNVNNYRRLAYIFYRYNQFDTAIIIYKKAQNKTKNEKLFLWDLAIAYDGAGKYHLAIEGYVKYLADVNKNGVYMVFSKVKNILEKDKTWVTTIDDFAKEYKLPQVYELLAKSYYFLNQPEKAILGYSKLDKRKFNNFINNIYNQKHYKASELALLAYIKTGLTELEKVEAEYKLATAMYMQNKIEPAKQMFLKIYNDEAFFKKYRYRTKARYNACNMLYMLALDNSNFTLAEEYLKNLPKFGFNTKERKLAKLEYAKFLHYSNKNFDLVLNDLLKNEDKASEVFKKAKFLLFEDAIKNKKSIADTLLIDIIVDLPDDENTLNALELSFYNKQVPDSLKTEFWQSYNLLKLKQTKQSAKALTDLYLKSQNDVFIIYALKAKANASNFKAKLFENETYLKLQKLETDKTKLVQVCTEFLTKHPNDSFAALFRYYLSNQSKLN